MEKYMFRKRWTNKINSILEFLLLYLDRVWVLTSAIKYVLCVHQLYFTQQAYHYDYVKRAPQWQKNWNSTISLMKVLAIGAFQIS